MSLQRRTWYRIVWLGGLAALMVVAGSLSATERKAELEKSEVERSKPAASEPSGPRPSEILEQRGKIPAPKLGGEGTEAAKSALAFVDWAAASTNDQSGVVRETIASARNNRAVVDALCKEAFRAKEEDHSRALVVIALLGEMQSKMAEDCLTRIVKEPLPEKGTVVEGVILEREALEILQAKAIDGLAYLGTDTANRFVLEAIQQHPSRIVRAEAIAAHLWNSKDNRIAREELRGMVRKEESIFIDRVVRGEGEKAETFNPKLDTFLKAHPELAPPKPEQLEADGDETLLPAPPEF